MLCKKKIAEGEGDSAIPTAYLQKPFLDLWE
jgi:hypothetical protein